MSKAERHATNLYVISTYIDIDPEKLVQAGMHLRALDASHRQLLEALENSLCALEVCGKDFDNVMGNARTAIAAAKELT